MTTPYPSSRDEGLPTRMRDYRIEAEPRESPDLRKLAQLFIGMARNRADQARTHPTTDIDAVSPVSEHRRGGEVESEQQEANG
ncbi:MULTISPECIES: hypothetical protein [unclassified Microbacterium]|uniref:hypothetical protein n=1 Tax=unclassified Microbacterium TaxID=2609290 RepID=UPI000EA88F45|nr:MULTISPECIES: hypothetical protein [unclassified Microbacterium]MBT2483129.1 hypothetical protein [Microbacterium sp. ISL-108]RKN66187.1 hypothetical protein D7252_00250 [Microbacterium sp. CGR2]